MRLVKAKREDIAQILYITIDTIRKIYPNYYPKDIVDFFLDYHSEEAILKDIEEGNAYLLAHDGMYIGTGRIHGNELGRMFVLPAFQKKGFGTFMIDALEEIVGKNYDTVFLDSSFPAYNLYLKRGYTAEEYKTEKVNSDSVLCYYVMKKDIIRKSRRPINLNNKVFISIENTADGEVSEKTIFRYHQQEDIIWAEYYGGHVTRGYLIGKFVSDTVLTFVYQHINVNEEIRMGECRSTIEIQPDGRLRLYEEWQWLYNDNTSGRSVVEEIKKEE
ncbi:GNAT family N-acetyltransferase [Prevotella sp. 10(H)]|uniref:GNAT family N-acetyltransferase n=1 Tax=Prevotella sp. 10(H) TaxID=1158294 RepID=UPI0004A6D944|nr:GNAT family N-acetyltransferase [Prevotella sp. 10(H)]